MAKNSFRYFVYSDKEELRRMKDDTFDDGFMLETTWSEEDLEYMAGDMAEDYFANHDGWEANWPQLIRIVSMGGKELGLFEVDMEAVPHFTASVEEGGYEAATKPDAAM